MVDHNYDPSIHEVRKRTGVLHVGPGAGGKSFLWRAQMKSRALRPVPPPSAVIHFDKVWLDELHKMSISEREKTLFGTFAESHDVIGT